MSTGAVIDRDAAEQLAQARHLLADALGGARGCTPGALDAVEHAEYISGRIIRLANLIWTLLPEEAEFIGGCYGDALDAIENAMVRLGERASVLDDLVTCGRVTDSEIDDIEARSEYRARVAAAISRGDS